MRRVPYFDIQDGGVPRTVKELLFALTQYFGNEGHSILQIDPKDLDIQTWPEEQLNGVQEKLRSVFSNRTRIETDEELRQAAHNLTVAWLTAEEEVPQPVTGAVLAMRDWLRDNSVDVEAETVLVAVA